MRYSKILLATPPFSFIKYLFLPIFPFPSTVILLGDRSVRRWRSWILEEDSGDFTMYYPGNEEIYVKLVDKHFAGTDLMNFVMVIANRDHQADTTPPAQLYEAFPYNQYPNLQGRHSTCKFGDWPKLQLLSLVLRTRFTCGQENY